jgi:thiamine-phosphate pyrophosphorylase
MNKYISKLHIISPNYDHPHFLRIIRSIIDSPVDWLQLRFKNISSAEVKRITQSIASEFDQKERTLIMNDYPAVCESENLAGVHLGKNDMNPDDARKMLGDEKVIGGTANSFDDILKLYKSGVDYIGLGPFRFTNTKKNLSPVLGLKGYETLLKKMSEADIHLPIIAIGGIKPEDVEGLMNTGVHGIAVSSAITEQKNPVKSIQEFLEKINN